MTHPYDERGEDQDWPEDSAERVSGSRTSPPIESTEIEADSHHVRLRRAAARRGTPRRRSAYRPPSELDD
jgi:hypothetical protein